MPKKIDKELIISLYQDGYTQRDIAYIVECSKNTVSKVLSTYKDNKTYSFKEITEEDIFKIIHYYKKGYSATIISKLLNVRASKVLSILEEYL